MHVRSVCLCWGGWYGWRELGSEDAGGQWERIQLQGRSCRHWESEGGLTGLVGEAGWALCMQCVCVGVYRYIHVCVGGVYVYRACGVYYVLGAWGGGKSSCGMWGNPYQ